MILTTSHRSRRLAVAAAALLLLPLSACSSATSPLPSTIDTQMPDYSVTGENLTPDRIAEPGGVAGLGGVGVDASGAPPLSVFSGMGSSVVTSGSISLEVADPRGAAHKVTEMVSSLGGSIDSQSSAGWEDGSTMSADLSVRVPSEKFDTAFDKIEELGTLVSENRNSYDVATQQADLSGRITSLEESIARLEELATKAANVGELIPIESELTTRKAELEGLKAQSAAIEHDIDQSLIWVSLRAPMDTQGSPHNFWEGVLAGIASIGAAAAGFVVFLGFVLPWILLLTLVILITRFVLRAARRRKQRAQDTQVAAASTAHATDTAPATETTSAPAGEAPAADAAADATTDTGAAGSTSDATTDTSAAGSASDPSTVTDADQQRP